MLAASLFTKVIAFVTSLVLVRILSPSDYGVLSYVLSTLAFFIPFAGGGLQHSYMRFAPLETNTQNRAGLFKQSLIKGLLISAFIAFVLFIAIPFLNLESGISPTYFYLLLIYLFTYFILEMVKVNYRVQNNNKKYASVDASTAGILFFVACFAAYYYGPLAYIFAFVCVPLFIGLAHLKSSTTSNISLTKEYYSYGLWVGVGSIASQLMYSLDVFLVGQIIQDTTQIAIYRSASIIPLALFFIPNSYITTHYISLAENSRNKLFLVNFAKEYCKVFLLISMTIAILLYAIASPLITTLFGENYIDAVVLFRILLIGMVGAFVFRIPFGNLLAAVGKSNWNAIVAFAILFLNGVLNYFALNSYGLLGAAVVTSSLLWISGFVSLYLFYKYLKQLS